MANSVVFDLDGTLLDTLRDLAAAGNHTLRALGFAPRPVDEYRAMVGNGIPKLVQRFLPPAQQGRATQEVALALFQKYYDAHSLDTTSPYPGVAAMLAALKADGYTLGVLSNKADGNAKEIVDRFFPQVFDAVAGLQAGYPAKPNPSSLFAMMEQNGMAASRTVYVGDSNVDVETAHNAGLYCVGVTWGFRGRAELTAAGADALVDDAGQLQKAVVNYFQK